jgi:hypothetical protein
MDWDLHFGDLDRHWDYEDEPSGGGDAMGLPKQ